MKTSTIDPPKRRGRQPGSKNKPKKLETFPTAEHPAECILSERTVLDEEDPMLLTLAGEWEDLDGQIIALEGQRTMLQRRIEGLRDQQQLLKRVTEKCRMILGVDGGMGTA